MMNLEQYSKDISHLCKQYGVKDLFVVGSVAKGKDKASSDVDLVVNFHGLHQPGIADRYFDLLEALRNLFNKPVDLIEETAIRNPIFLRQIEQEKIRLYGQ